MFDNESTPVKACNDLPYYVSNNGNEMSSFDSHDITNFLNSYTIACFCLWKLFFIQNGGIELGNQMQRLNFYWNWGRFERERVGTIQRPFFSSEKAEDAAVWIRSLGNSSLQRRGFLEIQGRRSDLTINFYGYERKKSLNLLLFLVYVGDWRLSWSCHFWYVTMGCRFHRLVSFLT